MNAKNTIPILIVVTASAVSGLIRRSCYLEWDWKVKRRKKMNRIKIMRNIGVLFGLISFTAFLSVPAVIAQQIECDDKGKSRKVIAVEEFKSTSAVFNNPISGPFDTTPLLHATIEFTGRQGCVTARLSTVAVPFDNYIVYQVRIDGVPMKGHMPGFFGIATPVVVDAEETDLNRERMVAHDFFAVVGAGSHRIEVLWAGCCSAATPVPGINSALSGANVLTIEY
jgi:hypothetical protein